MHCIFLLGTWNLALGISKGNLVDDERTNLFAQLNINHPSPIITPDLINSSTLPYYCMNPPKPHSIVNPIAPFLALMKEMLQIEVPQISP